MAHPIQPIFIDSTGTPRFKRNQVVQLLLCSGPATLEQLRKMVADGEMPLEDLEQLLQLLGYTVCGLAELDFTSDQVVEAALQSLQLHQK